MREKILVALAQVLFILALVSFLLPVQAQITQPGTPAGAILYFDRTTATGCPSGWTEYTGARGRYITGLVSGGTKATGIGSALTDQEDRTHTHTDTAPATSKQFGRVSDSSFVVRNGGNTAFDTYTNPGGGGGGGPENGGAVTGGSTTSVQSVTIAPYIQLLVCQKS